MAVLQILNASGHTEVAYDVADEVTTRTAEAEFKAQMAQGKWAYVVRSKSDGSKDREATKVFPKNDPTVESVIIAPRVAGG